MAGAGDAGLINGTGAVARFNNPVNAVVALDGTIYVADFDNSVIRRINLNNIVSTFFTSPNFDKPFGMTIVGNALVVQTDGNDQGQRDATTGTIWKINLQTGTGGVLVRNIGRPRGLALLTNGKVAMGNLTKNLVQILDSQTGAITNLAGQDGVSGSADGTGTAASFNRPYGVTEAPDGTVLVADQDNNKIRRVTLDGKVTTFAGTGAAGFLDGVSTVAKFDGPQSVQADGQGNVYVGDNRNFRFRKIRLGAVTTLAGTGIQGFSDGSPLTSAFFGMEGFGMTPDAKNLIIADGNGGDDTKLFNRVRRLSL